MTHLAFRQMSFPNLNWMAGIPGLFMSLFSVTAVSARVCKDRGWIKALRTTLSTATGVMENLMQAPF